MQKKKKNRPIDIQEIKNPIRVHFGICLGDFLKRCYDLKRIYHEGQENVNAHKSYLIFNKKIIFYLKKKKILNQGLI